MMRTFSEAQKREIIGTKETMSYVINQTPRTINAIDYSIAVNPGASFLCPADSV